MKLHTTKGLFICKFLYASSMKHVELIPADIAGKTLREASPKDLRAALRVATRNRERMGIDVVTTTCVLRKATSETESIEIGSKSMTNHVNNIFVKAEGRKITLIALLDELEANGTLDADTAAELKGGFFASCPKSRRTYNVERHPQVTTITLS